MIYDEWDFFPQVYRQALFEQRLFYYSDTYSTIWMCRWHGRRLITWQTCLISAAVHDFVLDQMSRARGWAA